MLKPFQLFPSLGTHSDYSDAEKQISEETCSQNQHPLPTLRPRRRRLPFGIDASGKGLQSLQENMEAIEPSPSRSYRILPIFSGIMIPFSIMLLIPSLTGHWYIRTGNDNVVLEVRSDPLPLKLAMGFSMGCAIIASACLVARFSERHIKLTTHLCIVFLSLHGPSFLVIVDVFFLNALTQIS